MAGELASLGLLFNGVTLGESAPQQVFAKPMLMVEPCPAVNFLPAQPTPAPGSVTMAEASASGSQVAVRIQSPTSKPS